MGAAALTAPYMNKRIKLKSVVFDTLDDEESGTNSYFRLKHVSSGSYLRIMGDGKSVDTRSPWEKNMCKLMLEKKGKGVYFIKAVHDEIYLRFEEKRMLGYNE